MHEGSKKELPQNGESKVTIWLFYHQNMPKIRAVAQKGIIILCLATAFNLGRIAITHARRAKQIKRHIGKGQIFLQHRRVATPLA